MLFAVHGRTTQSDGFEVAANKAVACKPCGYLLQGFPATSALEQQRDMANAAKNFCEPQFCVPPCAASAQWLCKLVATPVLLLIVTLQLNTGKGAAAHLMPSRTNALKGRPRFQTRPLGADEMQSSTAEKMLAEKMPCDTCCKTLLGSC